MQVLVRYTGARRQGKVQALTIAKSHVRKTPVVTVSHTTGASGAVILAHLAKSTGQLQTPLLTANHPTSVHILGFFAAVRKNAILLPGNNI